MIPTLKRIDVMSRTREGTNVLDVRGASKGQGSSKTFRRSSPYWTTLFDLHERHDWQPEDAEFLSLWAYLIDIAPCTTSFRWIKTTKTLVLPWAHSPFGQTCELHMLLRAAQAWQLAVDAEKILG